MERSQLLGAVVVFLISAGIFLVYQVNASQKDLQSQNDTIFLSSPMSLSLSREYYLSTYNATLKLFKECPYSNVYFVESDNLLASIAIKYLGLSYPVKQNIANNLTLSPYLVLLGIHNFSWNFRGATVVKLYKSVYETSFINSSNPEIAWYEYADLSFLYSIYLMENHYKNATNVFATTMKDFWDGHGMVDEAFHGYYSSYKVALGIIAWKYMYNYNRSFAMGFLKDVESMYSIASHLQSPDGGFYTCYTYENGTVIPYGNVNTETTSLFVIAFQMYPQVLKS
ncbi:hypothetical protein [Sulfuracidifex metallicus]|uniref:Uncharacterized protein n=1 Tax=Sulfuracidifex metallicus DSM 6482 = JCM 9184 TaxID=523847 RepID=A0A6A9QXU0_SULME|nr:hypothetical protein [Sulfuracidifex metallicus]MUN29842.1 hypothetical protein [Sulfuracidifex metallicus DSM 6482 = JCM 9184]WOE51773.1 hypothetical protein RQ359_001104 [Sulfuracidifex metallicus DSM 6482 = JCM 9184]